MANQNPPPLISHLNTFQNHPHFTPLDHIPSFPLKKEPPLQNSSNFIPPWLDDHHHQNNNNSNNGVPTSTSLHLPSPHMSATALLQKAAQMGATMSSNSNNPPADQSITSCNFGLHLSSSTATAAAAAAALPPYRNSFCEDAFGGISRAAAAAEDGNLSTRDFLGLRAISHSEFLNNIAAYSNCINVAQTTTNSQTQIQKPWQG